MTGLAATLALQRQEAPQGESLLALINEDVACVQLRDPAARGRLESLLLYPGVHALIWHRIAHRLWKAGAKSPARNIRRNSRRNQRRLRLCESRRGRADG